MGRSSACLSRHSCLYELRRLEMAFRRALVATLIA